MNPVFADTSYYAALLSPKDYLHGVAVQWLRKGLCPVVVTEFVLLELGNGFHAAQDRQLFIDFQAQLRADPNTTLIPASSELLGAGLKLYRERVDKEWSLTDCTSFVVMQRQGLTDALTADHHFAQAGFRTLMK